MTSRLFGLFALLLPSLASLGCPAPYTCDRTVGSGPVVVHASWLGAPVAGATVVVHGPDGAVKTTLSTDASGQASFEVEPHGAVTVALDSATTGSVNRLFTIVDVVPGDVLAFGDPDARTVEGEGMSSVDVGVPAGFTSAVDIETPCGGGRIDAENSNLNLAGQCRLSDGDAYVLGRVVGADGDVTDESAVGRIAVAGDGATAALEGFSSDVETVSYSATYREDRTDPTADLFSPNLSRGLMVRSGAFDYVFSAVSDDGDAAAFEVPTALPGERWVRLSLDDGAVVFAEPANLLLRKLEEGEHIDANAELLPSLSAEEDDDGVLFFSFERGGNAAGVDGAFLRAEYSTGDCASFTQTRWDLLTPMCSGEDGFTFPSLPDTLADRRPPGDTSAAVLVFDLGRIDGYDAAVREVGVRDISVLPADETLLRLVR